jgi:predicted trehalose synthase
MVPLTDDDVAGWRTAALAELDALLANGVVDAPLRARVAAALDVLPGHIDAVSSRAHGRLALRRVLLVDRGPVFVGFGEALAERSSPLKDVASLARSFDALAREAVIDAGHDPTTDLSEARALVGEIVANAFEVFVARYAEGVHDLPTVPRDPAQRDALIAFFRIRDALRAVSLERRRDALPAALDLLKAECPA